MKLLILCFFFLTITALETFHQHKVLKISNPTQDQVQKFLTLYEQGKIDIWTEKIVDSVDIRVPFEYISEFTQYLQSENIKFEVLIDDLQKLIDVETKEMSSKKIFTKNSPLDETFFDSYRKIEEFNAWMAKLQQKYPNLVELVTLGKTYENRTIHGVKIHNKSTPSKHSLLIHGGIHAREWISPTTVSWILYSLLSNYNNDTTVKKMVDNLSFHVFPVLNVDGFVFTHTNNRMWRKTRAKNQGSTCIGTDPNRNWSYKWNTGGSSSDPCSEIFHGSKPFDQMEVDTMANYGRKLPNFVGYIDYHASGQLFMRPWGFSKQLPPDEARLKVIGDESAEAIRNVRGRNYRSGNIATIIYVASGSSADYFYGVDHKVNAYAVELGTSFVMPVSEIKPVGRENFEGFKVFSKRFA